MKRLYIETSLPLEPSLQLPKVRTLGETLWKSAAARSSLVVLVLARWSGEALQRTTGLVRLKHSPREMTPQDRLQVIHRRGRS